MSISQRQASQKLASQKYATQVIPSTLNVFTLFKPKMWLDASDVVKDGDNKVSQWIDRSGNNFHALQSTAADQPLWVDDELNGQPVLQFDGSSDVMKIDFGQTFEQPGTLIFVHKMRETGNNQFIIDRLDSFHYLIFKGADNVSMNAGSTLVSSLDVPYDYTLFTNIFNMGSARFYINGVLNSSGNVGSHTVNGFTLGARYNNVSFASVNFAEIIFYDRLLTTFERQTVEKYLMNKYAL